MTARVEDQRKKLEESQALLVSNQQMIQWLNGQVNEAQLGRLGASSRYSFRPSAPLPTPSASGAGGSAAAAVAAAAGPGPAGAGAAGGGSFAAEGLAGSARRGVLRGEGGGAGDGAEKGVTYKPRATVPAAV